MAASTTHTIACASAKDGAFSVVIRCLLISSMRAHGRILRRMQAPSKYLSQIPLSPAWPPRSQTMTVEFLIWRRAMFRPAHRHTITSRQPASQPRSCSWVALGDAPLTGPMLKPLAGLQPTELHPTTVRVGSPSQMGTADSPTVGCTFRNVWSSWCCVRVWS